MIVFCAIGAIPPWTREALLQARASNSGARIVVLCDAAGDDWRRFAERHAIELHDIAALRHDARWSRFLQVPDSRLRFFDGFWQHTTSRFFALRAFMECEGIDAVTHLENDVLLYAPLTELSGWPPFDGAGIATVFESGDRAIPGLVRIGARSALDRFLDFVLAENGVSDDMHRLAAFRRQGDGLVADLPTVPPEPDVWAASTRSLFAADAPPIPMAPGGWLFDGARFGQYLGGVDRRLLRHPLQRLLALVRGSVRWPHGFINESALDDPSRYRYVVTCVGTLAVPAVVVSGRVLPLATLHMHSKQLGRFSSRRLARQVPSRPGGAYTITGVSS